jgi:16S rRNA (guanine966-N2)-methyltransferase
MRIIAGTAKGRKLRALTGWDKRPTTDRVKESVFSILGEKIVDSDVLDLFAGTGSLGIEALSRGARNVLFVDDDVRAVKTITKNVDEAQFRDRSEIWTTDVFMALRRLYNDSRLFDMIFADPPYRSGYGWRTLSFLNQNEVLREDGIFVLEGPTAEDLCDSHGRLKTVCRKVYGQTAVHFFEGYNAED